MRKLAVIQSNYLPWKGYFDIIHDADVFVFYDTVQFTKNSWRNRNRIKTRNGPAWLTVPVGQSIDRLVCDVAIETHFWQEKHWKTLQHCYGKTPGFRQYRDFFEDVYMGRTWTNLSDLSQYLTRAIAGFLGIKTEFKVRTLRDAGDDRLERLLRIVRDEKADVYISGPAGQDYIDAGRFAEIGVKLEYKNYTGYPEYRQPYPPFEHAVSVVDLLFSEGSDACYWIWGWRGNRTASETT